MTQIFIVWYLDHHISIYVIHAVVRVNISTYLCEVVVKTVSYLSVDTQQTHR